MASRLERLLRLNEEIRRGKYPSVDTLCEMLAVQQRTLFADIKELREKAGMQIAFDRVRGGYYLPDGKCALPVFDLSAEELYALLAAREHLQPDRSLKSLFAAALVKICNRVPDAVRQKAFALLADKS